MFKLRKQRRLVTGLSLCVQCCVLCCFLQFEYKYDSQQRCVLVVRIQRRKRSKHKNCIFYPNGLLWAVSNSEWQSGRGVSGLGSQRKEQREETPPEAKRFFPIKHGVIIGLMAHHRECWTSVREVREDCDIVAPRFYFCPSPIRGVY